MSTIIRFANFFLPLTAILAGCPEVDAIRRSLVHHSCTVGAMSPVPTGGPWSAPHAWDNTTELEEVAEIIKQKIHVGDAVYVLGGGSYGQVYGSQYICFSVSGSAVPGAWIALKRVMPNERTKRNGPVVQTEWSSSAPREVAVMRAFNAVSTYGVTLVAALEYESENPAEGRWVLIMEACENSDMQSALEGNRTGLAAFYLDAMTGVSDMHKNKLIHRDLKPANILITKEGRAKLTDFGSSCSREPLPIYDAKCGRSSGTPFFLPPEYYDLAKGYDMYEPADMWAMGLILYQVLHGPNTPTDIFGAANQYLLGQVVKDFDIKSDAGFRKFSEDSLEAVLLGGLLETDEHARLTAEKALPLVQKWAGLTASPPPVWRACPA